MTGAAMCTATAEAALKESFGCDGQPGSYADIDHADAILTVFFEMPRCLAIARIGICSARCSLRISAQSSRRSPSPS